VRDVLDAMRGASGVELTAIHADGGATANALLMQFTADMTGLDVHAAEVPECSALGAVMAGALGTGLYRSPAELAALRPPARAFRPSLAADRVAENYQGWRRAVQRVLARDRSHEEVEATL
jgi:glycerol kinase